MSPLLEANNLRVTYAGGVAALRGVDLRLEPGERVAITGESGSGKSTLARALAGLIQPPEAAGSVRFGETSLIGAPAESLRALRWRRIAYAPQGAPFNPVATIGDQLAEPLRVHSGASRAVAGRRIGELADQFGLQHTLLDRYPNQCSGGQLRRAMVVMALALDPELVILDEPTAGLDPASRHDVVSQLQHLSDHGFALIVISHDLPDLVALTERTVVLYAGEVMEQGASTTVVGHPQHPYSWALIGSFPVMTTTKDLRPIRGLAPDSRAVPDGCPFHPRCTQAEAICAAEHPALRPAHGREVACHFGGLRELLVATDLSKTFGRGRHAVQALREVSIVVREGEAVGLVGPSGSGKSTLAHILAGQMAPDSGSVLFERLPLSTSWQHDARMTRSRIQLVQQDPWDAVSPRMTVADIVAEPLQVAGRRADIRQALQSALASVGLATTQAFLATRSHELSGGQLQRVALARALVSGPKVLVADEPTAMLDASEAARLLVALRERQAEMGLGLLFVSHDIATVRKVTDRIVVLDNGRIVEQGRSHVVCARPQSLTARRLVATAPAFYSAALTDGRAGDDEHREGNSP